MIRSLLSLKYSRGTERGENLRRSGRVMCDGVRSSWGEITNVSASGARIIARREVTPKQGETAVLIIQGLDGPFELLGKVVWITKRNWGKRELGVQFVDVQPAARHGLNRLGEMAGRGTAYDGFTQHGKRRTG